MVPPFAERLTRLSLELGRLDQALRHGSAVPAVLFRQRLDAIQRHSAVDGWLIDPWYLVAELHGLVPKVVGQDGYERGTAVDAASHVFTLWRCYARPDAMQTSAITEAEAFLNDQSSGWGPILDAGIAFHRWLQAGQPRAPFCAALSRYWHSHDILRTPLILTGIEALAPGTPWEIEPWLCWWLNALLAEARDAHDLLRQLERARTQALEKCGAQRRHSRAPQAVNVLAIQPLVSASMLADRLGMSMKSALQLLSAFQDRGIVVEVTHRTAHRLFGLAGMGALRDVVKPPTRPIPGRKRGRPRKDHLFTTQAIPEEEITQLPPSTRLAPVQFDYEDLAAAMNQADEAMLRSSRLIARLKGQKAS
ncbi:hypothetical protein [Gluconobacter oxydans]|uniref:Uncharacterized protein n=1 Tax=Gluconobacter oxydans TaxID=442 RepID=A0A149S948_GLUOY|nr:hypothetical protein [Gluconobacter oxydans]KXV23259.1 hypothetical protein AD934_00375 [Gluconobacter oxydans]